MFRGIDNTDTLHSFGAQRLIDDGQVRFSLQDQIQAFLIRGNVEDLRIAPGNLLAGFLDTAQLRPGIKNGMESKRQGCVLTGSLNLRDRFIPCLDRFRRIAEQNLAFFCGFQSAAHPYKQRDTELFLQSTEAEGQRLPRHKQGFGSLCDAPGLIKSDKIFQLIEIHEDPY